MLLLFAFPPQQVGDNQNSASQYQGGKDQCCAVHEKVLGQYVDNLIGTGVENPVILAGEEQSVEDYKGTVEIQRRQAPYD